MAVPVPFPDIFSFWSATMIRMWQEIKEEKQEHIKYWEAKTTQLCEVCWDVSIRSVVPIFWSPSA